MIDICKKCGGQHPKYVPCSPNSKSGPISKWNYYMSLAFLSARRSKDPSTQVGASIISVPQGRILGLGYNGFPNGCKDVFPMGRDGKFLDTKYPYMVHAEVNAIMNATASVEGAMLFCTLYPCNECAKIIVQAGISTVVYWSDKYHNENFSKAARSIFFAAEIETIFLQKGNNLEYKFDFDYDN